jgi:hypothetical protein
MNSNLIEKKKPSIHAGVEKEFAEIEAQKQKIAVMWAGLFAAGDTALWFEDCKKWESEGCKGDKPERSNYTGKYRAALVEAEAAQGKELADFEKEVETFLKK